MRALLLALFVSSVSLAAHSKSETDVNLFFFNGGTAVQATLSVQVEFGEIDQDRLMMIFVNRDRAPLIAKAVDGKQYLISSDRLTSNSICQLVSAQKGLNYNTMKFKSVTMNRLVGSADAEKGIISNGQYLTLDKSQNYPLAMVECVQ